MYTKHVKYKDTLLDQLPEPHGDSKETLACVATSFLSINI